eukprot:941062-Amphidinium_carterae.2
MVSTIASTFGGGESFNCFAKVTDITNTLAIGGMRRCANLLIVDDSAGSVRWHRSNCRATSGHVVSFLLSNLATVPQLVRMSQDEAPLTSRAIRLLTGTKSYMTNWRLCCGRVISSRATDSLDEVRRLVGGDPLVSKLALLEKTLNTPSGEEYAKHRLIMDFRRSGAPERRNLNAYFFLHGMLLVMPYSCVILLSQLGGHQG